MQNTVSQAHVSSAARTTTQPLRRPQILRGRAVDTFLRLEGCARLLTTGCVLREPNDSCPRAARASRNVSDRRAELAMACDLCDMLNDTSRDLTCKNPAPGPPQVGWALRIKAGHLFQSLSETQPTTFVLQTSTALPISAWCAATSIVNPLACCSFATARATFDLRLFLISH